jgi:hypothetical protein
MQPTHTHRVLACHTHGYAPTPIFSSKLNPAVPDSHQLNSLPNLSKIVTLKGAARTGFVGADLPNSIDADPQPPPGCELQSTVYSHPRNIPRAITPTPMNTCRLTPGGKS